MPKQSTEAARRPVRQSRAGATAALAFANFLAGLVQTVVIAVQGELPNLLEAPRSLTAWIVTATVMVGAALSPVAGRLGDLYGRARILAAIMAVCTLGSVVGGLAGTAWGVVIGRGLQGVAIAAIPLGISILKDVSEPARLGRNIAIVSGGLAAGSAVGLPVGAALTGLGHWLAGFWLCALLGLAATAWILLAVPDTGTRASGRFDAVGALGVVTGTCGLVVGLSQGLTHGWTSAFTLAALGTAAAAGAAAAVHLWRAKDPLIDLRASIRRPVLVTNLAAALLNFAMMASFVALPQVLSLQPDGGVGLGLGVVAASLIMTANGLATTSATPLVSWFNTRHGPRLGLISGALIVAVQLGLAIPAMGHAWLILCVNILLGVGFGLCFAAAPQLIMASVAADDVAAANGLNAQVRIFATAAAGAVAGAILAGGGPAGPGAPAFQLVFLLGAGAAIAGAALALAIPRGTTSGQ